MADRRWTAADFDYPLPAELIAQVPPTERGDSRLLVVAPGHDPEVRDDHFGHLPALIPPGDLLVVNSTRVRPERPRKCC
jgi:S-adenosylmethionine:tRNA ribosyltransferase-isomerase